jgi:hypothetical protein
VTAEDREKSFKKPQVTWTQVDAEKNGLIWISFWLMARSQAKAKNQEPSISAFIREKNSSKVVIVFLVVLAAIFKKG